MKKHYLHLPYMPGKLVNLQSGDKLYITGTIYTARDQAHRRLIELIETGQELPFDLAETAIFYCGPSPKPETKVCGAIGPTTSSRMDALTLPLLEAGLKLMIGKGERSAAVKAALQPHGALYLSAIGGVSAVLARTIVSCETFLWAELGAEAIYKLEVKNFPCYYH